MVSQSFMYRGSLNHALQETDSCTTCGVSSSSIAEDRSRIKDLESKLAGLIQYGRDANKVSSCATEADVYGAYS